MQTSPLATGDGILVHYNEIGLKGRNRGFFERALVRNITDAVDDAEVEVLTGRLIVHTEPSAAVLEALGRVFGVASYSPVVSTTADIEAMTSVSLALLADRTFETFAVAARRATKDLPLTSQQINVQLGAAIQAATGAGVNLGAPDAKVHIEVIGKRALLYIDKHPGPGGLPVGASGKVVCLLSGGIDSPVAAHQIMRRGAKTILCHFHSAPFTDRSSVRKAAELAQMLAAWQGKTTMYVVALGDAQQQVVLASPPDLRVVLYRRLMVRIASEVARIEGAKALVTGDSLGQVASQTLENLACVDDASPLPILRPLIGSDKLDIVDHAQRIGTYETSIQPFEDCCSLFVPKSPATRATVEQCRDGERDLDIDALVSSCVEKAEIERFTRSPT